jgi:hypothetical protein
MEEIYIQKIKESFKNAEQSRSKLTKEIIDMEGMSGHYTRHFYNNILTLDDARYFEIGTWKGSSVCSAMYGNKAKVLCVDNWSEFNGPRDEFINNFYKYKGDNDAGFLEKDCFSINPSEIGKFNIYMYDGDHSYDAHYKALTHFIDCLDDTFIFIVDDWSWKVVRDATKKSIEDLNLKIVYEKEITTHDGVSEVTPARWDILKRSWWNGMYVAVLKKN